MPNNNGAVSVQPRFDKKTAEASNWLWTFWDRYVDQNVIPEWGNPGRVDKLREFARAEPILIGALSSMTSKAVSLDWQITGGRNRVTRYQEILAEADNGAGWSFFLDRWLQDYWQADQGGLVELGRQGKRGPVVGMYNLDAATCQLTTDPARPVNYYPRMAGGAIGGKRIPLEPGDFTRIVDLPSADESKGGLGFCATSRALKVARVLMALYNYEDERLSDMPVPGIASITGMTQSEVKAAFDLYNARRESREQVTFKGVLWLAAQSSPINPIDVKLTSFASLPEGFDKRSTIELYVYTLALDFGVDVREFWPASQTGATKAEAEVQAEKAKGKGFGRALSSVERAVNWDVLPEGLEFLFDQKDSADDLLREQIREKVIGNISALSSGQVISVEEARRWLVELEMAPEWLAETNEVTVHGVSNTDEEGPEVVEATQPAVDQAVAEKARRARLGPGEDFVAINGAGQVVTLWSSRRVFAAARAKAYNPDQPRDPRGSDTGGQWTDGGAGASSEADPPDWTQGTKLASEISGVVPEQDGKPAPVETRTLYHVTKRENLPSLLKDGFDIERVKPRWTNDFAISLNSSKSLSKAMEYFTPNVSGAVLDTDKFAVVAVTVRGRFFQGGTLGVLASDARGYTRQVIAAGYDASDNVFVYNPRAISRIHVVNQATLAEANAKLMKRRVKALERAKAATPDDPLDAERREAEALVAAALYVVWATQFRRLRGQIRSNGKGLLAARRGQPLGIVIGLDWGAEEQRLLASLGPVLEDVIGEAGRLAWGELSSLGVNVSWEVYDQAARAFADRYTYDLVTQINASTREQLGKAISGWVESGQDLDALTEQVRRIVPDNPYPFIRDRARLIAQTETTRVYAESRMAGLKATGLHQMVWQTANDELVCFPAWTMVSTEAGQVPIQDIKPGDMVWTRQGLKPVTATSKRQYRGSMVTVKTGLGSVTATAGHRFWTIEKGWLQGRYLDLSHTLETLDQQPIKVLGISNFLLGYPANTPPMIFKKAAFLRVSPLILMPVGAINLNSNAMVKQEKVDRVAPHFGLLDIANSEGIKCEPNSFFDGSLPLKLAVASERAKLARFRRANPQSLSAIATVDVDGRPATFFRAIAARISLFVYGKLLATPFAPLLSDIDSPAFPATNGVTVGNGGADLKCLTAHGTDLDNHRGRVLHIVTSAATVTPPVKHLGGIAINQLATYWARQLLTRQRGVVIARVGAELTRLPRRAFKGVAALLADGLKRHGTHWLTDIDVLYHKLTAKPIIVYDIQVSDAPEFYANGILVHNCPICRPLHNQTGSVATGILNPEDGMYYKPPAHVSCRCWITGSPAELEAQAREKSTPDDAPAPTTQEPAP